MVKPGDIVKVKVLTSRSRATISLTLWLDDEVGDKSVPGMQRDNSFRNAARMISSAPRAGILRRRARGSIATCAEKNGGPVASKSPRPAAEGHRASDPVSSTRRRDVGPSDR